MNHLFIEPELTINPKEEANVSYLRKCFTVDQKITNATLQISACGVYKAYLNEKELDTQVFLPGRTSYDHQLQYQEYDVTDTIQQGKNVIAAALGNGWYRDKSGYVGKGEPKKLKLMCRLNLTFEDGSTKEIVTDSSWKATQDGPGQRNDMKLGELYDARKELPGWTGTSFDDSSWHSVLTSSYSGRLIPSEGERIEEHETFKPQRIFSEEDGIVLDFGQNIAGYVEFQVAGPVGTEIELICGEVLDENGKFTVKNLGFGRNKKTGCFPQTIKYILKEGSQTFKPLFSVQGFQFVKLINWPEKIKAENFTAIAVYSSMKQTGTFECSNLKINRLIENIRWSAKGNFLDVPTDCPTRERAGWTGDAMVYSIPATYQMDTYKFLVKWLKDVVLEQGKDGRIRNIVPDGGMPTFMDGAAGWSDAIVKIPWVLYEFYGDTEVLHTFYPAMKRHVDFMEQRAKGRKPYNALKGKHWNYIIDKGFHWGEWLEPGSSMPASAAKGFLHPDSEVATAYFAWSVGKLSQIAKIIGQTEDTVRYERLYHKIVDAYHQEFLPDGKVNSSRQCRYVRPIALGLVNDNQKADIVKSLNLAVKSNGYKIGTGFLSTPHVCNVLSDNGYAETAYRLLENEEQPGWLFEVNSGATTIWENWYGRNKDHKPVNSHNHYSPGAVIAWLYSRVAGIQPLKPGFAETLIAPVPGGSLTWVNCSYESAAGRIVSNWKYTDGKFELAVEVPGKSLIILPNKQQHYIEKGCYHFECEV